MNAAAVFRLLCGREYSNTIWTWDTTAKPTKPSRRTQTAACTYGSLLREKLQLLYVISGVVN